MFSETSLQLDLSIIHQTGDETNYQPNGEFELEGFRPERHVVYYSCCKEPYIDITYYIRLRRRPMFYVFNLILPCILINGIGEGYDAFAKGRQNKKSKNETCVTSYTGCCENVTKQTTSLCF